MLSFSSGLNGPSIAPKMTPVTAGRTRRSRLFLSFSSYCFILHKFTHHSAGGGTVYSSIFLNGQIYTNEDKHSSNLNFHFHLAISVMRSGFGRILPRKLLPGSREALHRAAGERQTLPGRISVCASLSAPIHPGGPQRFS